MERGAVGRAGDLAAGARPARRPKPTRRSFAAQASRVSLLLLVMKPRRTLARLQRRQEARRRRTPQSRCARARRRRRPAACPRRPAAPQPARRSAPRSGRRGRRPLPPASLTHQLQAWTRDLDLADLSALILRKQSLRHRRALLFDYRKGSGEGSGPRVLLS